MGFSLVNTIDVGPYGHGNHQGLLWVSNPSDPDILSLKLKACRCAFTAAAQLQVHLEAVGAV